VTLLETTKTTVRIIHSHKILPKHIVIVFAFYFMQNILLKDDSVKGALNVPNIMQLYNQM
jgi:hypothetical protein